MKLLYRKSYDLVIFRQLSTSPFKSTILDNQDSRFQLIFLLHIFYTILMNSTNIYNWQNGTALEGISWKCKFPREVFPWIQFPGFSNFIAKFLGWKEPNYHVQLLAQFSKSQMVNQYSNDLNTGLVQYSNGGNKSGLPTVLVSDTIQNPDKMSHG